MKRLTFPIFSLLTVALALSVIGLFSGCNSTDARRSGRVATGAAMLAVEDNAKTRETLSQAKARIDAYLATNQPLTASLVDAFALWLATELDRNPAAIRIVVNELKLYAFDAPPDPALPVQVHHPALEFLRGVSDALSLASPQ